jgi:hypothetical protein
MALTTRGKKRAASLRAGKSSKKRAGLSESDAKLLKELEAKRKAVEAAQLEAEKQGKCFHWVEWSPDR